MTYKEILRVTAKKKREAILELNNGLKGPCGFLVKAEIQRNIGKVAWLYLAKGFCEMLEDNLDELMDGPDAMEVGSIYTAWQDGDTDLYNMLPVEAQLFTKEVST